MYVVSLMQLYLAAMCFVAAEYLLTEACTQADQNRGSPVRGCKRESEGREQEKKERNPLFDLSLRDKKLL